MVTPIFLETKLPEEVFDPVGDNMTPIRYYLWEEGIQSIDESFLKCNLLLVNRNFSIRDMCQDIYVNMSEKGLAKSTDEFTNLVLFKEKYGSTGVMLQDITSCESDLNKSIDSVRISEGCRIFVDFRNPDQPITNWQQEFDSQVNRYCIRFNNPYNGPVDQWENGEYKSLESTYENNVFLESGQT